MFSWQIRLVAKKRAFRILFNNIEFGMLLTIYGDIVIRFVVCELMIRFL